MISPLLANIYLDPLDAAMAERGRRMVRYADDFVILCRTREEADAPTPTSRASASPARVRAAIIGYPYKSGVLRMIDDRKPWLALGMRRDRNSSHETEINFSLLPNFRLAPAPATPQ